MIIIELKIISLTKNDKYNISPPKNIILKSILANKILKYSPKKINENPEPPYSTLNPETNSDSPSEKSNGVRLSSARKETNNIKNTGNIRTTNQIIFW